MQLLIAGGLNTRIFRGAITELTSNERSVRFLGRVTDVELRALYAHADGLICPSVYEGFGLPPVEAVVHGCPRVLASDIPVFREVLADNASYFRPDDVEDIAARIRDMYSGRVPMIDKNKVADMTRQYSWQKARDGLAAAIEEAFTL